MVRRQLDKLISGASAAPAESTRNGRSTCTRQACQKYLGQDYRYDWTLLRGCLDLIPMMQQSRADAGRDLLDWSIFAFYVCSEERHNNPSSIDVPKTSARLEA